MSSVDFYNRLDNLFQQIIDCDVRPIQDVDTKIVSLLDTSNTFNNVTNECYKGDKYLNICKTIKDDSTKILVIYATNYATDMTTDLNAFFTIEVTEYEESTMIGVSFKRYEEHITPETIESVLQNAEREVQDTIAKRKEFEDGCASKFLG